MAELSHIDFIYAIQYVRSHFQEWIEDDDNAQQVDHNLATILKQPFGNESMDQFLELIIEHGEAYTWWLDFQELNAPPSTVRRAAADGTVYGDPPPPSPRLIRCAKCGFSNSVFRWNDQISCGNSDSKWSEHYIEL